MTETISREEFDRLAAAGEFADGPYVESNDLLLVNNEDCDKPFTRCTQTKRSGTLKDGRTVMDFPGPANPPPADKRSTGLYGKFCVTRTDGRDSPGEKHHGCQYFVLDVTHDPFALAALAAYAESCRSEYPVLASDIDEIIRPRS